MSSGDKNASFRCIIWTKEIFFRQRDTCPFLTKGELNYKNPLKRSVLKSQFQNQGNLGEKDFFNDSHKNNFQFMTAKKKKKKKKIKYAFRPTTRWIIRSNNEILRKN